jgi:predicted Zn-dependent protease
MRRGILLAALAGAALLGCGEINAPVRPAGYEYRFFIAGAAGGVDTLAFAWPSSRLPMKIYVADELDFPARMQRAIDLWKAQFLYGEFDAALVSDSNAADVIVRAEAAPAGGPIVPLRLLRRARECEGATDLALDTDLRLIQLPMRIYVRPIADPGAALEACLDLTLAHELGHTLGIFEHSPDPADLMAQEPVAAAPTAADRATAERMFHGSTTLTVADR